MSNPNWTESIRQGNFQQAEEELSQAAAGRIIPALTNAYLADQLATYAANVDAQAGYIAKYVKPSVLATIEQETKEGKFKTPQELAQAYQDHMREAVTSFKNEVRPGEQRTKWEPYLPADAEVKNYIQERMDRQADLKTEGAKINQHIQRGPDQATQDYLAQRRINEDRNKGRF